MSELPPAHDPAFTNSEITLNLTEGLSLDVSPSNTQLVEYTGEATSRNHLYLYTVDDKLKIRQLYLFQIFDPQTYDSLRQYILDHPDYPVALSDQIHPEEEAAYQLQVDQRVAEWKQKIPDNILDFLITITH